MMLRRPPEMALGQSSDFLFAPGFYGGDVLLLLFLNKKKTYSAILRLALLLKWQGTCWLILNNWGLEKILMGHNIEKWEKLNFGYLYSPICPSAVCSLI